MKNFLNAEQMKQVKPVKAVLGVLVACSFLFAKAFSIQGIFNSLAYTSGTVFNFYFVFILSGLLMYGIYYLVGNIVFSVVTNFCVNMTRRTGRRPVSKDTFRLNLDFSYLMGNLLLGAVSLIYYFYPVTYLIARFLVGPIVLTLVVVLFYLLMRNKVDQIYQIPFLVGMGIPYMLILLFI